MLSILVNILLPVFLVAGISAIAQQQLRLDVDTFSKAAFYVFSPAMVIDALVNSDVSGGEYGQLALGLVMTSLAIWAFGEIAGRLLRLDEATHATFLVTMLLGNTGNYGLPVNLFAFGEPGLARAALVVTVSSMIRSSLGVYLAARGRATSPWESLRQVLSVPVIYAVILGLFLNLTGLTLPEPVGKAMHIMGQGLVPASLIVLGAQVLYALRAPRKGNHRGGLLTVSIGRLVMAPLIAYLVGGLIGMDQLARNVLTLECATPSAVMSLVLATEFETNVPFAALTILVTTFASLVTVTLWLTWLMA